MTKSEQEDSNMEIKKKKEWRVKRTWKSGCYSYEYFETEREALAFMNHGEGKLSYDIFGNQYYKKPSRQIVQERIGHGKSEKDWKTKKYPVSLILKGGKKLVLSL